MCWEKQQSGRTWATLGPSASLCREEAEAQGQEGRGLRLTADAQCLVKCRPPRQVL